MQRFAVPGFLHEAFGETQTWIEFLATIAFGIGGAVVLVWLHPQPFGDVPLWRSAFAIVLIFDIFAGCVANFTRGTNDYYGARPGARWVFIAIHVHLPAVALLLGMDLGFAMAVWAYTIAAAAIVNALRGTAVQPFVGALLLASGLLLAPQILSTSLPMLVIAQLFMVKVLYAFAVDHYAS
jgi:hypothetical protein